VEPCWFARPRGIDLTVNAAPSGDNVDTDSDGGGSTRSADASSDVSTVPDPHDEGAGVRPLPAVTTDLFVAAGAQLAQRLKRGNAEPAGLEEVVRRVIDQCVAPHP
jgi:hypothetical protein